MKPGPKSGPDLPTLNCCALVLSSTVLQDRKTGSQFWARVLGGGVPPRSSLWSSLLSNHEIWTRFRNSSARCSQIKYMIRCGIQLIGGNNCSQKEQGRSSFGGLKSATKTYAAVQRALQQQCWKTLFRRWSNAQPHDSARLLLFLVVSRSLISSSC